MENNMSSTDPVREKKDELLDKADAALQQSTSSSPKTEASAGTENLQRQQTPFIAGS